MPGAADGRMTLISFWSGAPEAECLRHLDQVAVDRPHRAVRRKVGDPEHADADDEDRGGGIDAEPENGERHPGEAGNRPQHADDPRQRGFERIGHAGGHAETHAERAADHQPGEIVPKAGQQSRETRCRNSVRAGTPAAGRSAAAAPMPEMKPSAGASSQIARKSAKPSAASATAFVRVTSHAVRHQAPPQLPANARSYTESANKPSSGAALSSAPSLTW